jgi:hypothetical protein
MQHKIKTLCVEDLNCDDTILVHGRLYKIVTVQHRVRLGLEPVKPESPGEHTTWDACYSTLVDMVVPGEDKESADNPTD